MTAGLTVERAREIFRYDPESGTLSWATRRSGPVIPGREAGSTDAHGYRVVCTGKRVYKVHRVAWLLTHGEWPPGPIDHINGIRHDNRITNLRIATAQSNPQNIRLPQRNNTSGYLGVSWSKHRRKWLAQIGTDGGKSRPIG